MRQLRTLALLLILGAPSFAFCTKGGTATQPTPASTPVRQVTLGNSVVVLTGPWKFRTGDNMAWAQPDFDDSAWGTMDLTPPPGSIDPGLGTSGYVPGWTARGYKGYHGYAWYRLRVNIENNQTALSLKMPDSFDDDYQVYVNGKLIGQFGRFTTRGVTAYNSQPRAFSLPANVRSGPATIAIRMWMNPSGPMMSPEAGGLHAPPVLGQRAAIAALLRLSWNDQSRLMYQYIFAVSIQLLALVVAFGLFWLDRGERAYLYLGLTCAALFTFELYGPVATFSIGWFSNLSVGFIFAAIIQPIAYGLFAIFLAYWFRLDGIARLHRFVWTVVALLCIAWCAIRPPFLGTVVHSAAASWFALLAMAASLALSGILAWLAIQGIRKERLEGWLMLLPVTLTVLLQYQRFLRWLHVPLIYSIFGAPFFLSIFSEVLSLLIITVLLLRRFLHGQRERERWKTEMEQARQIQSLLVPVKAPSTPGFSVESVYHPASEVGGDFFHLRPGDDGSLLVVVGDVSGKGLKAAMTVTTIVGALRNEKSRQPAEILSNLNSVLYGQIKGFATCCACLIAADGIMTIANAGHIPPYRNGEELGIPGDVPLGILADSNYDEHRVALTAGDRLTFVSDGIVEAMNPNRELFGFERTQQISNQPAADIASTAQAFGQQDDITVLSVVLAPARVPQASPAIVPASAPNPA